VLRSAGRRVGQAADCTESCEQVSSETGAGNGSGGGKGGGYYQGCTGGQCHKGVGIEEPTAVAALCRSRACGSTTAEGRAWLASKAKEQAVVATGTGLMCVAAGHALRVCIHCRVFRYKVLKSGAFDAKRPSIDSRCECHYRGSLIDGREFDSSYSRGSPAIFAPNEVIKGWAEALQLMREGDHWQLYVPSELAYGDSSRLASAIRCGAVRC
jgi:hypothetical protein